MRRKLEIELPRDVAAAVLKAAERYGQSTGAYMSGAVLRQLLDDQAIEARALAQFYIQGTKDNAESRNSCRHHPRTLRYGTGQGPACPACPPYWQRHDAGL